LPAQARLFADLPLGLALQLIKFLSLAEGRPSLSAGLTSPWRRAQAPYLPRKAPTDSPEEPYSFAKQSDYPTLEPMIAGRINVALIRAHWSEILRIVASIRTGTVTASLIMRQLASYPRQNGVAAALRELGRLERTLFTLDWIEDPELRRTTSQELNKGESRNSLARAVFIHRLGEIRDCTYENQQHRASGLNLIVTAIILWNTRYLEHAVAALRRTEDVPDQLLSHLSPLGWEHVNLTGDYVWAAAQSASENGVGLRPLRTPPDLLRAA
jgi:hypothetical protein